LVLALVPRDGSGVLMTTSPLDRLLDLARNLGADELAVLELVAEGMVAGRRVYGELRVDKDPRDFRAEAIEELRDSMVYTSAAMLRLRRGSR